METHIFGYFHPDAGKVNGTWLANGGANIASIIRQFYNRVFGYFPAGQKDYLYNLYGSDMGDAQNRRFHVGVDMVATGATTVRSALAGEVTFVGGTFGTVAIYDRSRGVTYLYLHLSSHNRDSGVRVGEDVSVGTILGTQSNVGADGAHLHIEVRNGRATGPAPVGTSETTPLGAIRPYNFL